MDRGLSKAELDEMAVEEGFDEHKLADRLNVSLRHFRRVVHDTLGTPPKKWLRELRMSLAKPLLLREGSVKVVSAKLGYKRSSHFSRDFKCCFRISPKEFYRSFRHPDTENGEENLLP
jgi:AraC-like DNA-binding protein